MGCGDRRVVGDDRTVMYISLCFSRVGGIKHRRSTKQARAHTSGPTHTFALSFVLLVLLASGIYLFSTEPSDSPSH